MSEQAKSEKLPRLIKAAAYVLLCAAVTVGGYYAGYFSVNREEPLYLPVLYGTIESVDHKRNTIVVDTRDMMSNKNFQGRYAFKLDGSTDIRYIDTSVNIYGCHPGDKLEIRCLGKTIGSDLRWILGKKYVRRLLEPRGAPTPSPTPPGPDQIPANPRDSLSQQAP